MRRLVVGLIALTLVLSGLIAFRLHLQAAVLAAPAGGSGEIEGTEVDLASRLATRVLALHVKEGQAVKKGDLLVSLDCADARATVAEAEARLSALVAQAAASKTAVSAGQRTKDAAAMAEHAAMAQADALTAQYEAAARHNQRMEALAAEVAEANLDQVRTTAVGLRHQAEAARAQAQASSEQAQAAVMTVRAAEAQADAAAASVRAADASLARARLLASECEVRAPRDGQVNVLPYSEGELVSPGAVLVRLLDLSEPRAVFYLPNAEIAVVKPGLRAEVTADAYPNERFAATVTTVSLKAEFTPRNIQTRTDRDRLVYPVEVTVENRDGKLRAGMPVQVTLSREGQTP